MSSKAVFIVVLVAIALLVLITLLGSMAEAFNAASEALG